MHATPRVPIRAASLLTLWFAFALALLLAGCEQHNPFKEARPAPDDATIARGEYLAKAGDCAACHDAANHAPYAGGQPVNSPFGPIYASNITPDPVYGIGRYTLQQFADALRRGVSPRQGHLYPAMPYPSFSSLNDDDVAALYQYFKYGVKPVANATPKTHLPFPFNQRWVLGLWRMAFSRHERFTPQSDRPPLWNRGAYLVQGLGHCGACHTPRGPGYNELGYDENSPLYLTGGINDHWFAPNLSGDPASGLGRWSAADIAAFLRHGHNARSFVFGAMAPVVGDSTQYMSDSDLDAIAIYLKSLPPHLPSGKYTDSAGARAATARALDAGQPERPGAGVYLAFCARCHGADGSGKDGKASALAGSALALSRDPTSALRIVIEGSESQGDGPQKMPGFRSQLTDAEIAQVVNFVRGAWGNGATPIATGEVTRLRDAIHR
ncbi:MAG TPA: cytochrome c [Paraburkholderia sp.]